MGAKMIPMVKKRGRTVLGVRIGLGSSAIIATCLSSRICQKTYCHAFKRCWRNAVSVEMSASAQSSSRWRFHQFRVDRGWF